MSTALDIVTQVRSQTGKKNLLNAGATDLSTDAYWHLNACLKWLSRRGPAHSKDERYEVDLAVGAIGITPPRLRYINEVAIYNETDDEETYLERLDLHQLRRRYPEQTVEQGQPAYWARNNERTPRIIGDTIINGSFANGLTGWDTVNGAPSVSGGTLTLAYAGVGVDQDVIRQVLSYTYPSTVTVTVVVSTITAGETLRLILGNWDGTTYTDSEYLAITAAGTYTFEATTLDTFNAIQLSQLGAALPATVTVASVSMSATATPQGETDPWYGYEIVFNPPADAVYKMRVYGGYYPISVTAHTDETWWMEKEPECVIDAMRLSLEGRLHRNAEGEDQELRRLMAEVTQIKSALHWEEAFGSNQDLRLGL